MILSSDEDTNDTDTWPDVERRDPADECESCLTHTDDPPKTPILDGLLALRLLREVVGERPDYVYKAPEDAFYTCVYVHQHKPSCLVAHVLYRAGFDMETIESLDGHGVFTDASREVELPISDIAVRILGVAQLRQDLLKPWSEALVAAKATAERLGVSA